MYGPDGREIAASDNNVVLYGPDGTAYAPTPVTEAGPAPGQAVTADDLQALLGRMGLAVSRMGQTNQSRVLLETAAEWLVQMWNHIATQQRTIAELQAALQAEIAFNDPQEPV